MDIDVRVREVGLRDGLQLVANVVPTAEKIAWIEAEAAAGIREIEVTSLVPPKLMPQFADAEDVVAAALPAPRSDGDGARAESREARSAGSRSACTSSTS